MVKQATESNVTELVDKVFETEKKISDFSFNKEVAAVFDDMVSRSVPYYDEMQRMTVELVRDFACDDSNIYDIGCATGTTMALIDRYIGDIKATLIGIDNSKEMLEQAGEKLDRLGLHHPYELKCADIHRRLPVENASVVALLLTLQFARPLYRERIVRRICQGVRKNGCLLMVEKITSEDTLFNRLFIDHYYDFKRRNGYTEMEIANKREALENVLIPYRLEENVELLKNAGFRHVEVFFRWYNFCGLIASK
ncbi:MAG: carboxy-S-adenosyl-L-methionine synthase CmoA [Roseitalea porphyridii]|uniref:carboxy-S-adenosyl-L-methionine synthase CmoA n=1 Tax=Roseitalea porphyridii TaxID=1852022 RepID=UPI0032EC0D26